jgi:CBS domain containing-hemolysin-like protein
MFLSACFSASETAFFSLSRVRVQSLQKESRLGKRIASLLERPRRLIISILMGNEIVNIVASVIFTGGVVLLAGEGRSWLAPVLMTPLLMVFGEITPKSIAARFPESFARALAVPIDWFTKIITPVRWVFLLVANGVLSLLGARSSNQSNILMEDEFLTLVEAGLEEGELDETERAYIRNIFEFHDRTVGEITIPRTDMECWEAGMPLSEAVGLVRFSPYSRVPVYEGDRDHIVGVLYIKDFLILSQQKSVEPNRTLTREMVREPLFVPEGMKLDALFRLLRMERTHLAIVADEFGGVAGLVTMADLLDEIFGEIRDEFDEREEAEIEKQEDGSFVCQARFPLFEFTEKTGWAIPDYPDAHSVGGLVFTLLGRVPEVGGKVVYGGVEFTVLEAENTRVVRVRAELKGEGA